MLTPLFAGMLSIGPMLTSFGLKTFTGLSTVVVAMLLATIVLNLSWNALAKSTTLPALSFGKTVILTVLLGMLFFLVLVMISGSRELLTPGAWQPSGLVSHPTFPSTSQGEAAKADTQADKPYDPLKVKPPPKVAVPSTMLVPKDESHESLQAVRKESLVRLRTALWNYADDHGGDFPESVAVSGFPEDFWTIPVSGGRRYDYDPKGEILVRSPDLSLDAKGRLVP